MSAHTITRMIHMVLHSSSESATSSGSVVFFLLGDRVFINRLVILPVSLAPLFRMLPSSSPCGLHLSMVVSGDRPVYLALSEVA